MFVTENDLIEFSVYYKKNKHQYQVYNGKDFGKLDLKEDEKEKYNVLNVKMLQLNWGMYNALQEEAMVSDANGDRHFNFKSFRENKLKKLIKEWDAKKDEKPVPVTDKSISMLAPQIAECLLSSYDSECMLTEEEEGK